MPVAGGTAAGPALGANTVTALVWADLILAIPFLAGFIGLPLWLTFRRPETGADHSAARTYLRRRAALAGTAR